jgi:hypothetical protein
MNTKTTQIVTPNLCREMRAKINETLAELGASMDMSIEATSARFTDNNITFKLEVNLIRDGEVITPEMTALRDNYKWLGIPEEWLTATLVPPSYKESYPSNQEFKLVGYKPRATKRPFIIEDVNSGAKYSTSKSNLDRYTIKTK